MTDSTHPLYQIIARLDAAKIYFTLDRTRDETVMVLAQVPGRSYEIEVFENGQVEVEVYESDGEIGGPELVDELLRDSSDSDEADAEGRVQE
ncbi:MAG TPA: hypothetical protein VME24_00700 [Alphaproteobacteria bacterium]|nr:hypothetical protein [Alphaproteobacteria bacterium]